MKDEQKFLRTLFDEGEMVCYGWNAYSTSLGPALDCTKPQYVTINPLHTKRLDVNVTAYRNILIELDKGTLEEQIEHIVTSDMPFSTLVYSGGKSLHCIISLTTPLQTRIEYDNLVLAIYNAFGLDKIDTSCKNPSRFTRNGGAIRESNGVTQEILMLNSRVSYQGLVSWTIGRLGMRKAAGLLNGWSPIKPKVHSVTEGKAELTNRSKKFVAESRTDGSWRNEAFFLCCDAARSGYSLEEIEALLESVDGVLEADSIRIPNDAYNKVAAAGELGIKLLDADAAM